MSNIEFKDLTFGYDENLIFDHAQINIDERWKLGLVGRNGRGKSTLLKLLKGEISTENLISSPKNFIYFPQILTETRENTDGNAKSSENLLTDLTTLTFYLLDELSEQDLEQWKLERELSLLNVDLEVLWRPFSALSGGEQTKCLLALLFLDESNFPLIDEPTNHLDIESRAQVADYLKHKSGFIVVSHDRSFLDAVCDHILAIERRQLKLYQGNFSTYEQEKNRRDEFEVFQNNKLQKDISRLKQTALEKRDWSNQRENVAGATFVDKKVAKKQNQRAKSMEKRLTKTLSEKEELLQNIEKIEALTLNFQPLHHKTLLQFEDFSLTFSDQALFKALNFKLKKGEIVALTGANGRGKSSILRAMQGEFDGQQKGHFQIAQGIHVSYVRQIYDNRGFLKDFAQENQLNYENFLANLRKLGMERHVFAQAIETMSQGQQKKVELARSLSEPAQLYLWDEPLNYLDVFNHEQIVQLLKTIEPTMLLVEHDQSFITKVASDTIKLQAPHQ